MNLLKTAAVSIVLAGAGVFTAGAAYAELIDFTDANVWTGGEQNSPQMTGAYSIPGMVTLTASGPFSPPVQYKLNWTTPYTGPANDLAGDYDGVGISATLWGISDGDDEVSPTEKLTVSFANAAGVNRVDLLNLFPGACCLANPETVKAKFFDSSDNFIIELTFTGNNSDSTGYLSSLFPTISGVKKIEFTTPLLLLTDDLVNDAAVAAVGVVPIPAAVWLFGSALMGLAGVGSRRMHQA